MGIFFEDPKVAEAATASRPLAKKKLRGAGGTPGGLLEFFAGVVMTLVGFYLLAQRIVVTSALSDAWNRQGSWVGLALLAVLAGFALLFQRASSRLGWLLTLGGIATIVVLVFLHLNVLMRPTTLWQTLVMLALLGGGFGLVAASMRDHEAGSDP
jgi:hypothetical protein